MTRQQTARLGGALYLAMGLPGAFALVYIPKVFIIPGDATATASRIAARRLRSTTDQRRAIPAEWNHAPSLRQRPKRRAS